MKEKNILLTTMSISIGKDFNAYSAQMDDGQKRYCQGKSSMEPGSKYLLAEHPIDEIIAIGTKETHPNGDELEITDLDKELKRLEEKEKEKKEKETEEELSPFENYKICMAKYLLQSEEIDPKVQQEVQGIENLEFMRPNENNAERAKSNSLLIKFVPEQKTGSKGAVSEEEGEIDNINEIVKALYGEEDQEINLYLDVQGGNRTSFHVRNAVLSILDNQYENRIHIKKIVATNFNPQKREEITKIVNETKRYRIMDLVSGMNAFIRYGKADLIKKYCEEMQIKKDSDVDKLVNRMMDVDSAISLCDMDALTEAIAAINDVFEQQEAFENKDSDFVENIFDILAEGIKKDYGNLLKSPKDYLELVSWCAKKGFIQQALTLIEDKMPAEYFDKKHGLMKYIFNEPEKKQEFLNNIGQSYERREANKILYNLLHQCETTPEQEIKKILGKEENERLKPPRSITEDDLNTLKASLEDQQTRNEDAFLKEYCEFRRKEGDFERRWGPNGKYDMRNAENIYELFQNQLPSNCRDSLYFSIVYCCDQEEYHYEVKEKKKNKNGAQKNKTQQNEKKKINITLKLHSQSISKDKLEQLMLLHEALKKERNCCNHASEKGVRLPVGVVRRAIEIYVKFAKALFEQANHNDTQ